MATTWMESFCSAISTTRNPWGRTNIDTFGWGRLRCMPRCPANQWNVPAIEKVAAGQGLEGCLATRNFLGKRASSRTIGHQRKKIGVVGGGGVKKNWVHSSWICLYSLTFASTRFTSLVSSRLPGSLYQEGLRSPNCERSGGIITN